MVTEPDIGIIRTLKEYFMNNEAVIAVYLYGSQASKKTTPHSDVDVAVLLEGVDKKDYFDRKIVMTKDLEDLLKREADIIILNDANLFLAHQVYSKGIVAFVRDKKKADDWKWHQTLAYWDFLPTKRLVEDTIINRMTHGS